MRAHRGQLYRLAVKTKLMEIVELLVLHGLLGEGGGLFLPVGKMVA